jgi:bacterioferritin
MKGSPKVIAALNAALRKSYNQYFLHAEMVKTGILFLDATPNLTEPMKLSVGQNVKEQIASDLKLETEVVAMYNRFVQIARDEGDNRSRELFERLLR